MTLEEAKRIVAIKHQVDTYNLTVWMSDEAAELYASQFNKPPVYGQWIDIDVDQPDYMDIVLITVRGFGSVTQAQYGGESDKFSIGDHWTTATHWMHLPLPPSPGSVDVEEKKECGIILHNPSELPRPTPDAPEFSETVLIIDEHGLDGLGYYVFEDKRWAFHTDTLVDYNEVGHETKWKWYYPPVKWDGTKEPHIVDGLGDSSGSEKEKSQFREPSTQGGEECGYYTKNGSTYYGPLKAEIERLKQENERLRDKIKEYEKPKKQCPKCGSGNVVMFTPDLDLCRNCDNQFI